MSDAALLRTASALLEVAYWIVMLVIAARAVHWLHACWERLGQILAVKSRAALDSHDRGR